MGNDERTTDLKNAKYWLWLQLITGPGFDTEQVNRKFGGAAGLFSSDSDVIRQSGIFTPMKLKKVLEKNLEDAENVLNYCLERDYGIVTCEDEDYPKSLFDLADYPMVLYCKGDTKMLKEKLFIGVIGTRRPTVYGVDVARSMTRTLAKNGAVIVSGGAQGIDSAAHETALENGGKTILIMGCGFDAKYLPDREKMRNAVAEKGLIISEFPPLTAPYQSSFIMRNRITAGLCRGVLVIEAGENSGTISTARKALNYERDLFVVTGDVEGSTFLGSRDLVKRGAKIVFSGEDILSLYGYKIINKESFDFSGLGKLPFNGINNLFFEEEEEPEKKAPVKRRPSKAKTEKTRTKPKEDKSEITDTLPDEEKQVYEALCGGKTTLEDIARSLEMNIRDVLVNLTELEFKGLITTGADNEYLPV